MSFNEWSFSESEKKSICEALVRLKISKEKADENGFNNEIKYPGHTSYYGNHCEFNEKSVRLYRDNHGQHVKRTSTPVEASCEEELTRRSDSDSYDIDNTIDIMYLISNFWKTLSVKEKMYFAIILNQHNLFYLVTPEVRKEIDVISECIPGEIPISHDLFRVVFDANIHTYKVVKAEVKQKFFDFISKIGFFSEEKLCLIKKNLIQT